MTEWTLQAVCTRIGVPNTFVAELVEAHIVEIHGDVLTEAVVERIRVSWTLHNELGVNLPGVEVALNLLELVHRERVILRSRS